MYILVVAAIALSLRLHGADAGAVLMGIQVTPLNASDADMESYLTQSFHIARGSVPFFHKMGHNFSTFVCISPGVSAMQRVVLLNKCFQQDIPHIAVSTITMETNGVCTIEHPELESYDVLFHLNFDSLLTHFDFEAHEFDDSYFVAPTSDIIEAKQLYRTLKHLSKSNVRSISSLILDLLKDSDFSLFPYLPTSAPPTAPSTDPRFPLFQPASSESIQKSRLCSLQWPRDGTKQYSMNKRHEGVYVWNKWVIDCDIDPTLEDEFNISFVGRRLQGFEKVTVSGSQFKGGELILPYPVKTFAADDEGSVSFSLVISSHNVVMANFSIRVNVVFPEYLESTLSLINPMISQAPPRLDIGTFFNGLGLQGTLIEVGFSDAEFTSALLEQWVGASYLSVTHGITHDDAIALNGVLQKHVERASYLNGNSSTVQRLFADNSVDVICIQGVEYHEVISQLQIWWPKLKRGGVVYGRKYSIRHNGGFRFINNRYTAGPAVDEFASNMKVYRYITVDEGWYFVKPL